MTAISDDKKLKVQYNLEPGCLGPDGDDLIEKFCEFAQQEMANYHSKFILWNITPRAGKSLPEVEYRLAEKRLDGNQAGRYLKMYKQDLAGFEEQLDDKLMFMIENSFDR